MVKVFVDCDVMVSDTVPMATTAQTPWDSKAV